MYILIKEYQQKGFSARKIAKYLGISRDTVKKYSGMTLDQYQQLAITIRKRGRLDIYQSILLDWLRNYPGISAAQIHDWLLEHYSLSVSQRTLSRVVKQLRLEHGLKKKVIQRDYEACDERPMGVQMQLDFGVKNLPLANRKGHRKVYFAGFILAHSRYKYGYFIDHPFTTADLIVAMNHCFAFFGGVTKEIVIDQDSILTVAENQGDIIYTSEFEKYRQQHQLSMHVCRKADPESKGMVESMVKFVKINFLEHREYMEADLLNECFLAWLARTGNAKVHGTTKKVPAHVFDLEREHLRPILVSQNDFCTPSIIRSVRKDNTILYKSNRYSLPLGTFAKEPEVSLKEVDGKLQLWQVFGDYMIHEHPLSKQKGQLIKNTDHRRKKEESLDRIHQAALTHLSDAYEPFLQIVRNSKPRYYRDQLMILEELLKQYPLSHVQQAIAICHKLELTSFNDVKDACRYSPQTQTMTPVEIVKRGKVSLMSNPTVMNLVIEKRDIHHYTQIENVHHE